MDHASPLSPHDVLEVRDKCLCFAAQRAARRLARRFDLLFRDLGITNGQFSMMTALSAPRAWKHAELADFLSMDRTTATAAIKALERRGLVTVATDPKDKRGRRIILTSEGRKIVGIAVVRWREEHAALDDEVTSPVAAAARKALRALNRDRE